MPGKKTALIAVACVFILSAGLVPRTATARDIRIITPYLGSIRNVYKNDEYRLDLKDSSLLKGLYVQWINTERFQWNLFVYQSSDINYSTLWGGHFIFDYYFGGRGRAKYVAGAGLEIISLDMDAGSHIDGLSDFKLENSIYIPYLRFGRYFPFDLPAVSLTLLPWAGLQPQFVRGNVSFNFGGPFPPPVDAEIEENDLYALAGLNARAVVMHFLELEAKYHAAFGAGEYLSTVSTMVNFYLSRRLGLSYRFKFMETGSGSDSYHIGGIAIIF
jgi:hypothetical protein